MPKVKNEAAAFRKLARTAEKIEKDAMQRDGAHQRAYYAAQRSPSCFTCNEVEKHIGVDAKRRYRDALISSGDEINLWNQLDCPSIRVVMLCFAAAMAETGDL